jgi:hypothetical protein
MIERLAQFTDVRAALVVGGLSLSAQAAALRTSPEIVVATPVRCPASLGGLPPPGLLPRCRRRRPPAAAPAARKRLRAARSARALIQPSC